MLMILTNVGLPFAATAYALTFEQPTFNQPNFKQPEFKMPEFEQPDFEQPEFEQPEFEQPNFGEIEFNNSQKEGDFSNTADIHDPTKPSPINPNDGDYGNESINNENNGSNSESNDSNSDSNYVSDEETFFTWNELDFEGLSELFFKEILGGTVDYANEVLLKDPNAKFSDHVFKWGDNAFSIFSSFTEDDPTVDAIDGISDAIEAGEAARDGLNFYRGIKTITPGNAVLSAISLPFSAIDTWKNGKEWVDASNSDERWEAGIETVNSFGNTLLNAAPIVAFIPGVGQGVVAGLAITGGVLAIGSTAVKLWRNRREIINDIGKKVRKIGEGITNTVRSIGEGISNAVDSVTGFFRNLF